MDEVALVQRIEMLEETVESLRGLPRRVDALEVRMAGVESQVLQLRIEMRDGFLATATKADLERHATKDDLERFATKEDLERFATKEDLERFATKEDLERFATKEDLERFATKEDLERFARKEDLERFATKEDLQRYGTREDLERFSTKEDLAGAVAELREEIGGGVREMAGHLLESERRSEERMRILIEDAMSRVIMRIEGNPRAQ